MAKARRRRVSSDLFLISTSLIIAFVVWVIAKGGNLGQIRFTIPVQITNVPAHFDAQLTPDSSEGVIMVTLPNSLRSQVQPSHFVAEVDWNRIPGEPLAWCGIEERRVSAPFKIGSENVHLSSSVPDSLRRRLQEHSLQMSLIDPEAVAVEAKFRTRKARVNVRTTGNPAPGYQLASPVAPETTGDILLTGSENTLERLDPDRDGYIPVPTEEIDLNGQKESRIRKVGLKTPDGVFPVRPDDNEISVQVRIEPVTASRMVSGVPIRIEAPEKNLQVSHSPLEASVRVKGPEALLQRLSASDLVVGPAELLQGYDGLETIVPLAAGFGDSAPADLKQALKFVSVSPTTATAKFRESSGSYRWQDPRKK